MSDGESEMYVKNFKVSQISGEKNKGYEFYGGKIRGLKFYRWKNKGSQIFPPVK